jgi:hypothetical protein
MEAVLATVKGAIRAEQSNQRRHELMGPWQVQTASLIKDAHEGPSPVLNDNWSKAAHRLFWTTGLKLGEIRGKAQSTLVQNSPDRPLPLALAVEAVKQRRRFGMLPF